MREHLSFKAVKQAQQREKKVRKSFAFSEVKKYLIEK